MTFYIAPIVEGDTEKVCIERLLQRIWSEHLFAPIPLRVLEPSRGKRDAMINQKHPEFLKKIEQASQKLASKLRNDSLRRGMLLILLDAESACPATLAPDLLGAAQMHLANVDIACILAKKMFENWIVAGASTLAGVSGLPDPLPVRDQFEDRSGAAWIDNQLRSVKQNRAYKKTIDAQVFVRRMNLQECRANSPSFDKLCRSLAARLPPPPADVPATGG